jgi:hypothetical protein
MFWIQFSNCLMHCIYFCRMMHNHLYTKLSVLFDMKTSADSFKWSGYCNGIGWGAEICTTLAIKAFIKLCRPGKPKLKSFKIPFGYNQTSICYSNIKGFINRIIIHCYTLPSKGNSVVINNLDLSAILLQILRKILR